MKKFLCVLCVLAVGATSFAAKFGLDFSVGAGFGFQNADLDFSGVEGSLERMDMALPSIKVATYDFFLLDDMLGLHAQLGFSPFILTANETLKATLPVVGEIEAESANFTSNGVESVPRMFWGMEFLVGPAFGIDLNETVRFQTGMGFHLLFAMAHESFRYEGTAGNSVMSDSWTQTFLSYGIGLTPQLRFTPNKLLSFLVGCDLNFDFGGKVDKKYFSTKLAGNFVNLPLPDNSTTGFFRFEVEPYIGVGINF